MRSLAPSEFRQFKHAGYEPARPGPALISETQLLSILASQPAGEHTALRRRGATRSSYPILRVWIFGVRIKELPAVSWRATGCRYDCQPHWRTTSFSGAMAPPDRCSMVFAARALHWIMRVRAPQLLMTFHHVTKLFEAAQSQQFLGRHRFGQSEIPRRDGRCAIRAQSIRSVLWKARRWPRRAIFRVPSAVQSTAAPISRNDKACSEQSVARPPLAQSKGERLAADARAHNAAWANVAARRSAPNSHDRSPVFCRVQRPTVAARPRMELAVCCDECR
jgi:hypothetical protein